MHSTKRSFVKLLPALGVAALLVSGAASAQTYPSKPIKIVVGFPAGGLTDQVARLVANGLTRSMGQQVVVENRPGGNTLPATQYVAKAPADGYTLYQSTPQPYSVNVAYYRTLPYGRNDFTPIAMTSEIPMGIYVPADSPFKTLGELVAHARANPGKLSYASAGSLTQGALGMEAFKHTANLDIQGVPYQGNAPALVALMGNQIHLMMSDIASAAPHIQAGKLRVLVVAQKKRLAALPDAPTMDEAGFGNVNIPLVWNGVFGPPNLPKAIVDKLNAEINAAMQTPEALKFLKDSSLLPAVVSPARVAALVQADYDAYAPLLSRLGLKSPD